MRVLVTGASGFIGRHLLQRMEEMPQHQVSGTYNSRKVQGEGCDWHQADLTDQRRLEEVFRLAQPEVVVHLAAIADVGECEREPLRATEVNARNTENIARLCGQHGAKLVFLSTEYVFDGQRGNYREDDKPEPTTHYGHTKWLAEQAVSGCPGPWSIIRTSLVFGWPAPGGHGNLATAVIGRLERNETFFGHVDMYRTPIYVGDLIEGLLKLVLEEHQGIFHLAGAEWVNMHEFAQAVAEVFRLDPELVKPAQAPTEGSEGARPRLLGLDSSGTVESLGVQQPSMMQGLAQMQKLRRVDS